MSKPRCSECGFQLPSHDFTCSKGAPLPGWRGKVYDWPARKAAADRRYRQRDERDRERTEMLGRPYQARLERNDPCPAHGNAPWLECQACIEIADGDYYDPMEAGL